MTGTAAFEDDYRASRARFRRAAARAGGRLEQHDLGLQGPDGTPLTIDAAVIGPRRPGRAVVVTGGLHGVEGPLGAAVMAHALEIGLDAGSLPPGLALVLVHALNPHGYAHGRRFDAENVDLNRNFLPEGQEYAGSPPLYAALDPFLNPRQAPGRLDPFPLVAPLVLARHGLPALKQAIAGGQYDFPLGLFFGGRRPSPLAALLADRLRDWLGTAEDVLHLDFHTGLGARAGYQLLVEGHVDRARLAWLSARFPAGSVRPPDPSGIAYEVRGGLGGWCQALEPDRPYTLLCAEFGTYPPQRVLRMLRAENRAHHWGRPDDPRTRAIKARFRETFVPAAPAWRDAVVAAGIDLLARSLAAWGPGPFAPAELPERTAAWR